MLRSTASKVMWVGRATVFLVGLSVILALIFGVATTALGKNGNPLLLGRFNAATALTKLTGNVNGAAMQVVNSNAGANDTALNLSVQAGEAPMRVNSSARVANLNAATAGRADSAASADNATNAQNANTLDNKDSTAFLGKTEKAADADKLDGQEASSFANATHAHSGADINSGTVEADRIEDGSGSNLNADQLDGRDSTQFAQKRDSGMVTADISSVPAQSCITTYTVDPGAGNISNDVVVTTPSVSISGTNLVVYTTKSSNPDFFRIRLCNVTSSAIDPPSADYHWMIFDQP